MKQIQSIAYSKLTAADFFHTSKLPSHTINGGGQSYIDFSGTSVSIDEWQDFFKNIKPTQKLGGPAWDVEIKSLGLDKKQHIRIAARKSTTGKVRNVRVSSQKIHSREANRIYAWHPDHTNFPALPDGANSSTNPEVIALVEDLYVYIIHTVDGEYWAGYLKKGIDEAQSSKTLETLFSEKEGIIKFDKPIEFDETISFPKYELFTAVIKGGEAKLEAKPLKPKLHNPEKEIKFTDDLFENDLVDDSPKTKEITVLVRKRNKKAVSLLKQLYKSCQITGDDFVFSKQNGEPYLEAHHLVPLGQGGADHPSNLVVISAHVHRMLHYADVSPLDLSKIVGGKLPITINGKDYEISWKPEHVKIVEKALENGN